MSPIWENALRFQWRRGNSNTIFPGTECSWEFLKMNSYAPKSHSLQNSNKKAAVQNHSTRKRTIPCSHFSKSCNFDVVLIRRCPQTATSTDHLADIIVTNSTLSLPGAWLTTGISIASCSDEWLNWKIPPSSSFFLFVGFCGDDV